MEVPGDFPAVFSSDESGEAVREVFERFLQVRMERNWKEFKFFFF